MTDPVTRLSAALADRYRIERELGAGGMATVYLAHDVRHDRNVALKVLRPELSAILGAERFLHEIKTTANLQHPHILSLFDSGEADGLVYYVMPYIEGESLRDRLNREKHLPVDDAVQIAREVADALMYAHTQGVVHRDIKPENILLRAGHAMVADFGIALAASRSEGATRMTETGMSLGTPYYMAPEQAMGERDITGRADVYALGCVLYEMLSGDPPFTGSTAQAIMARVMTEEPRSLTLQRKTIPPHVEAAVERALQKLPADRWATAAEFGAALADASARTHGRTDARKQRSARGSLIPDPRSPIPWLILGLAGVAAWGWLRSRPAPLPVTRMALAYERVGRPMAATGIIALSPDGTMLAYTGLDDQGHFRLFIRHLDREDPVAIRGTEGGAFPFFSADGAKLAFEARGRLWRIPLAGGQPVEICSVEEFWGGAWGPDDRIVFAARGNLYLVSAAGGTAELLAAPDLAADQTILASPSLTADGRVVVASARSAATDPRIIAITLADKKERRLAVTGRQAFVVRGRTLVYVDPVGTLFAVPFDPRALTVSGTPVRIEDGVATTFMGSMASVAPNGAIAFVGGAAGAARDIVLVDRNGQARALPLGPAAWRHPRFSPDGRRLVIGIEVRGARGDLWTVDLASARLSRLTFDSLNTHPEWSPDGRYVYFSRQFGSYGGIARVRADGSARPESLLAMPYSIWEVQLTPDQHTMLFRLDNPATSRDIWWARTDSLASAKVLLGSTLNEHTVAISPDGRYFAYISNAGGGDEIYLRRLAEESSTWPVTSGGGFEPRWARSGRELFFRRADSLYVVPVNLGGTEPVIGQPHALFGGRYESSIYHSFYDASPDGTHFAMVRAQGAEGGLVIHLVLNWFDQPKAPDGAARPTP